MGDLRAQFAEITGYPAPEGDLRVLRATACAMMDAYMVDWHDLQRLWALCHAIDRELDLEEP